jgi:hypothetical protein
MFTAEKRRTVMEIIAILIFSRFVAGFALIAAEDFG